MFKITKNYRHNEQFVDANISYKKSIKVNGNETEFESQFEKDENDSIVYSEFDVSQDFCDGLLFLKNQFSLLEKNLTRKLFTDLILKFSNDLDKKVIFGNIIQYFLKLL